MSIQATATFDDGTTKTATFADFATLQNFLDGWQNGQYVKTDIVKDAQGNITGFTMLPWFRVRSIQVTTI